jgi:hypothetical protein
MGNGAAHAPRWGKASGADITAARKRAAVAPMATMVPTIERPVASDSRQRRCGRLSKNRAPRMRLEKYKGVVMFMM